MVTISPAMEVDLKFADQTRQAAVEIQKTIERSRRSLKEAWCAILTEKDKRKPSK